jgi:hypothetical protein
MLLRDHILTQQINDKIKTLVTVDDIKTINTYLGIDEYHKLGDNDSVNSIPFAEDEKYFKYFRKTYQGA